MTESIPRNLRNLMLQFRNHLNSLCSTQKTRWKEQYCWNIKKRNNFKAKPFRQRIWTERKKVKCSEIFWFSNSSSLPHPASSPRAAASGFLGCCPSSSPPAPAAALKQQHCRPGGPGSPQGPTNCHHSATSLCCGSPKTEPGSLAGKPAGF